MSDLDFDIEQQIAEQKKKDDLRRKRELSDIRKVLSTPEGRRMIWRIWSLCGTFSSSYIPKDATHTAFREGQRDIGLALLLDINEAKPEAYSQMSREFISELKSTKERSHE